MDLLEYQGKQLFARHGIPVPAGEPARTVDEAVAAANRIGYPCAIKAQVQVGGRGKLGGIKLASDESQAREHAQAILGMDIKGLTVRELWIEGASQIEAEYYASFVFDRGAKAPLAMFSTRGGMDIEAVADETPEAIATLHVDPLLGFQPFHGRRLAFEAGVDADLVRPVGAFLERLYDAFVERGGDARRGQPADRHARAHAGRTRREGDARRELALPPPRQRGAARPLERGSRRSGWRRSAT